MAYVQRVHSRACCLHCKVVAVLRAAGSKMSVKGSWRFLVFTRLWCLPQVHLSVHLPNNSRVETISMLTSTHETDQVVCLKPQLLLTCGAGLICLATI